MADLNSLRSEIDQIDDQIRILFLKRMEIVNEIAVFKMEKDMTVYDHGREAKIIEQNLEKIEDDKYREYYAEVLSAIMKVSKDYQKYLIWRSTL